MRRTPEEWKRILAPAVRAALRSFIPDRGERLAMFRGMRRSASLPAVHFWRAARWAEADGDREAAGRLRAIAAAVR